jgi:hypothetical protein
MSIFPPTMTGLVPEDEEPIRKETSFQEDQRLRAEEDPRRIAESRERSEELGDKLRQPQDDAALIEERREQLREKGFEKQEQIQERIQERREGFEQRREERRQRRAPAAPAQPPSPADDIFVTVRGQEAQFATQEAMVGGARTRLISPDVRRGFSEATWQSILGTPEDPGSQQAINVLGDTASAISQLDTPEARQFTQLYNQLESDRRAIEQDASLTESERRQAIETVQQRRATLAAGIPSLGDIGAQLERQGMIAEEAEAAASRKAAAEQIRDFESAFNAAQATAQKQEDLGFPVTPEQFQDILKAEIETRNAAADAIAGVVSEEPTDIAPVVESPQQYTFSNPVGGLVYGANSDGTAYARIEGAGPAGPKIPTRALGNTLYPAPATADQAKLLHKGTAYFPPGSATLAVATSGPDAPNEAALKKQAEDEKARMKFEQDEYTRIHAKQVGEYDTFVNQTIPEQLAAMQGLAAEYPDVDLTLTAEDVLAGRTLEVLGDFALDLSEQDLERLLRVPTDPNSEAGRQERERKLELALRVQRESEEYLRRRNILDQQRAAPYENSIAAFEPAIAEGRDVVVYTTDEGNKVEYEAYTITQPGSAFYGRSLPVIRSSDELMQISPDLYPNFAYYSPSEGRVLASVAARGSARGSYTPEEASTIMGQLIQLYPADFFDDPEDFEQVFDAYTRYMGYSGPRN